MENCNSNNNMVITDLTSSLIIQDDEDDILVDAVDYKHMPAVRSETGRWRSAAFIIGVEMAERTAYWGIRGNLINYLTRELGQSTAMAAASVNAWAGVATLLPVLGAVIADSFLGKYFTVIAASLLYILGLGLLTISAMLPSHNCPKYGLTTSKVGCSSHSQTLIFFGALYLVALGQGGHKPCIHAFGADQFDGDDPIESESKSSFFNWWNFGGSVGALLGIAVLSYIQDNLSWALGFGIPCIILVISLLVFVLGTFSYRFIKKSEGQSPFLRIGRVFVQAAKNRHMKRVLLEDEQETQLIKHHHGSKQFRFLDKAMLLPGDSSASEAGSTKSDVEEAKSLLRLIPIWATSLIYGIVFAQISTFFTKQGVTMDRSIGSKFKIPAAALQSTIAVFIITFIPIYDRLLIPFARRFTGKPTGISVLQRMGTGLFLSTVCMVVAALTETRRRNVAINHGLIDFPEVTVPMSIWWLLPQYALFGIAEVFTMVGLQEFFYGQVPMELRSVGISLFLSVLGVGNFLSSFLVSLVDKLTSGGSEDSWLSDNPNRAHLDFFYLLLAGLSTIGLVLFIWFARSYIYTSNKVSS